MLCVHLTKVLERQLYELQSIILQLINSGALTDVLILILIPVCDVLANVMVVLTQVLLKYNIITAVYCCNAPANICQV